jgi:UDP-N-acetylmuramyl pentapeptide phosphotransferase/UDP-N-acetylglucosamine-1-phosphate transferase
MNEIILVFTFILSFLLTIYGTPLAQRVAFRYQLLDQPDGKLKQHARPVPYMGGVIVYFSDQPGICFQPAIAGNSFCQFHFAAGGIVR